MVANSVMAALMIGIIVFSVLVVAVRYALKFFRVSNTSLKRYAYMTFRQPKGSSIRLRALLNNVERKRLSAERGRSDSERRKKGKMHGTGES